MMDQRTITERALDALRAPVSYPTGLAWFVCYCHIKCERRAAFGLNAMGIETYLPVQVRQRVRRGVVRKYEIPVFTRYLFVRFDPNKGLEGSIKGTDGIAELLENNEIPVRVPDRVIEAIKRAEQNGVFSKQANLNPGDKVRVPEGPFADLMGKVASVTPSKKIKVLLQGLHRVIPVEFSLADVEKIA